MIIKVASPATEAITEIPERRYRHTHMWMYVLDTVYLESSPNREINILILLYYVNFDNENFSWKTTQWKLNLMKDDPSSSLEKNFPLAKCLKYKFHTSIGNFVTRGVFVEDYYWELKGKVLNYQEGIEVEVFSSVFKHINV